jgi:hypothetical protein
MIRIIRTPPGEAPEQVRAAWVGLVLPLAVCGARTMETVGVLSRPKTRLGLFFARLCGRTKREGGYVVEAQRAVEILAAHAPEAAKWWRERAAFSIQPGQLFVFETEVCQEVTP